MKINYNEINTLSDLQAQIGKLKQDYEQKGEALKTDAKTYVTQFTPGNLFKKYVTPGNFLKLDAETNISGKIMSVVLPFLLNKTVLSGSGFITKALATLVTGKVAKNFDVKHITGAIETIKSLFKGKKSNKLDPAFVDYGIPPDSETY